MGDIFAYVWRKNLTHYIMERYLHKNFYYRLNVLDKNIDNPDQRIADDVNSLTQDGAYGFAGLITKFGTSVLLLKGFVTTMAWGGTVALLTTTVILGVLLAWLGTKKAHLIFAQDHFEGDYRYAHIRMRINAESIAFFSGEDREQIQLHDIFVPVVENYRKLLTINFWMDSITDLGETCVGQAGASVVLIISMWPSKPLNPDEIKAFAQTYTTALGLAGDFFSEFFDVFSYFNPLSTAVGNLKRIDQLLDEFDAYENSSANQGTAYVVSNVSDVSSLLERDSPTAPPPMDLTPSKYIDGHFIKFSHVTSYIPISNRRLARDLSFEVYPGENLVITGPSGCGKSSILRNLSGIWPITSGSITRPATIGFNGIMYMPQQPYFILGSLKEQICYPEPRADIGDRTLQKYLDMVGLGHLTERGSTENVDWKRELSKGEQQRLALARLFYHRPKFALLDESTSALDHEWERIVHEICARFHITLVSVGHRKSLYNYHSQVLHINSDGTWTLGKCDKVTSKILQYHLREGLKKDKGVNVPARLYHVPFIPPREPVDSEQGSLDGRFFGRVWKIISVSQVLGRQLYINVFFLVFVVALGFSDLGFSIASSKAAEKTLIALQNASVGHVFLWIVLGVASLFFSSFVSSGGVFLANYVGWSWRTGGTRYMHEKYVNSDLVYYNLQVDKVIDNPDQRIAADTRSVLLGIGSGNPWSRGLVETYARTTRASIMILGIGIYSFFQVSYLPPLLLVAWNIISYVPVHFLMRWLSDVVYKKEMLEGDFRFLHAHVRDNSEAIAFYKSEKRTLEQCKEQFRKLLDAQWSNLISKFRLDFIAQTLAVLNDAIAPLAIILSVKLSIGLDFSTMSPEDRMARFSAMLALLHSSAEALLDLFEAVPSISSVAGSTARVAEFLEVSERLAKEKASGSGIYKSNAGNLIDGNELCMDNVAASTPEGLPVVQDLAFRLGEGDNLLIMGPSGCGKSSLFRVLKGLWPLQHGTITAPFDLSHKGLFFLSQSAYFVSGSLRQQIIYPDNDSIVPDDTLFSWLQQVGIDYIATRNPGGFDHEELCWEKILSGGEQQRLVLCRLLYHKPLFAAMDESTSAVDQKMEKWLYRLVQDAGVTTISIGHRESLIGIHKFLLKVGTNHGMYELLNVQDMLDFK